VLGASLWTPASSAQALDRLQEGRDRAGGLEGPEIGDPDRNPNITPTVHVVGFQDVDNADNCDVEDARYGLCIERVEFMDSDLAWDPDRDLADGEQRDRQWHKQPDVAATHAQWTNTGELYATLWEDSAFRFHKTDAVALTYAFEGFTALPATNDQWDASVRTRGGQYALPDQDLWLAPDFWVDKESTVPMFPDVVYYTDGSAQSVSSPDMVILKGRFAERLGYEGRLYEYEIMNGDPISSGPFFEQMYPYESPGDFTDAGVQGLINQVFLGRTDDKGSATPRTELVDLKRRSNELSFMGPDLDYLEVEAYAAIEFQSFTRLLQVQIAQFAMEEHTLNQMRVFTALTAMIYPPGSEQILGRSGERLNPGSRGETDTAETIAERTSAGFYSLDGGFDVNYDSVPVRLVEEYISSLSVKHQDSAAFNQELYGVVRDSVGELLRPGHDPIQAIDLQSLWEWSQASTTGATFQTVDDTLKRLTLSMLMQELSPGEQDQRETWLLLDHIAQRMASTFDDDPEVRVAPGDLVGVTQAEWQNTLALHRYASQPIGQGLGAVDPTAVCSPGAGVDALKEASFGAITVDVLVEAPDGLQGNEVIWATYDQMPFSMLDNPNNTKPEVTRLVGLGESDALYRVRWRVWTGWHVLWTIEDLPGIDDNPSGIRLNFRTAAICEDMVLAPKGTVPTVVRASLLMGEFTDTDPVYRLKGPDRLAAMPPVIGQLAKWILRTDEPPAPDRVAPEVHTYLAELVREPLRDYSASGEREGMLLVVFDSTAPRRVVTDKDPNTKLMLRDRRPRTPYARVQSRARGQGQVQTASWAWFVDSTRPDNFGPELFPAYNPTESVEAQAMAPRYKRARTTDINVVGGLGTFPYRLVNFDCVADPLDLDVVAPCQAGDNLQLYSSGLAMDMGVYATIWWGKSSRWALETGPEVRLDVVTPTEFWLCDRVAGCNDVNDPFPNPKYDWALRPQLGLSVGVRSQPDPRPLARRVALGYPWGADRADGSSDVSRTQYGLRAGALVGPGYNGLEYTLSTEAWMAWNLRNKGSNWASFTPYHPGLVLGPYVRAQYGGMLSSVTAAAGADSSRYYALDNSWTVLLGLRVQYRIRGKQQEPEVPGI
jgi:hypothetical protein